MYSCEALLSAVSGDAKRRPSLPYAPLSGYNVFHVLEAGTKEVVMCRFLADLLHPEGRHGCGILFLKSFLEDVLKLDRMSDVLLAHTDVTKEYVIDDRRRIDIVIENARFLIPIEVKIFGEEQAGQCWDYYEKARNAPIVYLTRFGKAPSVYSRSRRDGAEVLPLGLVRCISWADDIYTWLASLLGQLEDPVKSVVMQYMDAVHAMADAGERKAMERTLEVLYQSPEYFGAGVELERAMKTAKLRLIGLVFDCFKEEMAPLTSEYGIAMETDARYYAYDEKRHRKFYDCYSTYPGLNYVVKDAKFQKSSLRMWFRIEIEHNLFAGFTLFDNEAVPRDGNLRGYQVNDITPALIEEAAQYLSRDTIQPVDWWLTYCYPNGKRQDGYYDDVPNFKNMNPCAVRLVDPKNRREFVQKAVKAFEEHLLKYLIRR